jgi:uncharacterized delta-60 repeat protein
LSVVVSSPTPVSYQWRRYGQNLDGATGASLTFPSVSQADGGVYTVLVSNAAGSVTSQAVLLNPIAPGWPDLAFANLGTDPLRINSLFVRPNGQVLVAGAFTKMDGYTRNLIARLNPDGRVDTTFVPSASATVEIYAVAAQSNGQPIIGGNLSWPADGVAYTGLGRLNVNGALDKSFNLGAGPDDSVFAVAVQNDDKVLVGGFFGHVNGVVRPGIARLHSDGSLDASFAPTTRAVRVISAIAVQAADGKVVIAGEISGTPTPPRRNVLRLLPNGLEDPAFNPGGGPEGPVHSVALQADGKVVIGGDFGAVNGAARNGVARLNSDGTLDLGFDTPVPNPVERAFIWSVAVQPDGKVIAAGSFTKFGGVPRQKIVRLNADGSVDASFAPADGANNAEIKAVVLLPDGNLLAGGDFTDYDGFAFGRLVRLHGGGSAPGARLHFSAAGDQLTFSWTDAAFGLQMTTAIAPANWTDVPGGSPQSVSTRTGRAFFRLIKR